MEHNTSESTQTIVDWVTNIDVEDVPASVIHESRRCLVDFLGTVIGGQRESTAKIVRNQFMELGGHKQATFLGTEEKSRVTDVALVNGIAAHAFDFDDTHIPTILHPTTPVYSSSMALGELKHTSGRDLLAAHSVAYELSARVSNALYPHHYDIGWHTTGTAGTLGALTASARILGLNSKQMLQGVGVAATQASGHREHFGTMTKPFHVGSAAHNGVVAALLASRGFTASPDPLEGRRAMFNVMSKNAKVPELTFDLGKRWQIFDNGVKPYACGVVTHPPIDAVKDAVEKWHIDLEAVERIVLEVHPLVAELTGKEDPRTGLEGKFSVKFACAIAMIEGTARERQFSDNNVVREDVRRLMAKIEIAVSDRMPHEQAKSTLYIQGGEVRELKVSAATGTPKNRISDEELEAKYMDLAEEPLGRKGAKALVDAAWNVDQLESVAELTALAVP